jgi:ubiquinone/menaquinone biosynthesis C-methylase UbiE
MLNDMIYRGRTRMEPKPEFLGPQFASAFQDSSVIKAYLRRPPYPEALFAKLAALMTGPSRAALDVGTGPGDVARRLAPYVERVDAVDWSAGMIALGKRLPGGDDPRVHWIQGRIEDVALDPPYGLITAGESLHWMDWPVILPRFRDALEPGGFLAIINRDEQPAPWTEDLTRLYPRYSTNQHFRPYNLIQELESRGLFQRVGEWRSEPVTFTPSVEAYIEGLHSMSGFSRERMPPADAGAFDAEARQILSAHAGADGMLRLQIVGGVKWGTPLATE